MTAIILPQKDEKILVISPIYDQIDVLSKIKKISEQYDLIIFNGNLTFPFYDLNAVQNRIDLFESIFNTNTLYNIGNYDLELLLKLEDTNKKITDWINSKSNVIILEYSNSVRFIIVNGGIKKNMTRKDIMNSMEVTFISKVDNRYWHLDYNGSLGYVISNNPIQTGDPTFYSHSLRMGTPYVSDNCKIIAQEVTKYGLKETFIL